MGVTFQKELFIRLMPELPEIFLEHHEEIEEDHVDPLDPDWPRYMHMEMAGQLHIMTMRADGYLAGYYFAVVVPNLHHKTRLCAYSDMFFVRKDFRMGWYGYRLLAETDKMLATLGVKKSYLVTKEEHPITILLKRLKYVLAERIYTKRF